MKKLHCIILLLVIYSITGFSKEMKREFYDAVIKGNLALVKKMISLEPNIIKGTDEKCTPLNWAAENGQIEMVQYLLTKGSNINSRNRIKFTPLHSATHVNSKNQCYYDISKLLIDAGADVNARGGVSAVAGFDLNQTPLHFAANNGNFELVKLLVEHGADVNAMNYEGATPLYKACEYLGTAEIVKYLISKGAKINVHIKLYSNDTPLHTAITSTKQDVVKILIENGADLYAENNKGETPLDFAERTDRKWAIQFLWPYYHPNKPYKAKLKPTRGFFPRVRKS